MLRLQFQLFVFRKCIHLGQTCLHSKHMNVFLFKVLQLHQFDLECSPTPCRRTPTLEDQCFSASLKMRDPEILCFSYPTSPLLIGFGGGFPMLRCDCFFPEIIGFHPRCLRRKALPRPSRDFRIVRKHQLPLGKKTRTTIYGPFSVVFEMVKLYIFFIISYCDIII